jgi:hypothetical protein
MFLAVPLTAIIRVILMEIEDLRPVGEVLGGRLPAFWSGGEEGGEPAAEGGA